MPADWLLLANGMKDSPCVEPFPEPVLLKPPGSEVYRAVTCSLGLSSSGCV